MVFAEKYAQITIITASTMLLALDVLQNAVLASIRQMIPAGHAILHISFTKIHVDRVVHLLH